MINISLFSDGHQFITNDNLKQIPSREWRSVRSAADHCSSNSILGLGSNIHDISLVSSHHHDSCDVSDAISTLRVAVESANWIRIDNNFRVDKSMCFTIQSPGENVNTLTRRSEYSGMTIVIPAKISNHLIKYERLMLSNVGFGFRHACIECNAP